MVHVVGVDLSLTCTGVASITRGGALVDTAIGVSVVKLGDMRSLARLNAITTAVLHHTRSADLVVLEGPSYGSVGAGQHERGGLWWMVYDQVNDYAPVAIAPPKCLKQYATGKGGASKDAVLLAVERRYPDVIDGNDTADALVLAAMGARHLGQPLEASLPAAHLKGMDGVAWP